MAVDCWLKHKKKAFLWVLLLTIASVMLMILYLCPLESCRVMAPKQRFANLMASADSSRQVAHPTSREPVVRAHPFDMDGHDVLVFLHIQKTGGSTFGKHLVKHIRDYPCACPRQKKRCTCTRPNSKALWIFSRYSLGWPCGLHADWTELRGCVPAFMNNAEGKNTQRKLLYVTILREPVSRFLSEFLCYQRGATWNTAKHLCNGRSPTPEELPPCYSGEDWTDVDMDAFLDCSSNLARNRQTRMLADLTLVNCYNRTGMPPQDRDRIMLDSAKRTLENMAYFALVEYQEESQFLFEKTFDLEFSKAFERNEGGHAEEGMANIGEDNLDRIRTQNRLDLDLYSFAKDLFMKRVKYFRKRENLLV